MILRTPFPKGRLAPAGLALALAACQSTAPAPGSAPSKDASAVAATIDGVSITVAELDERAKNALARVRQQEYEVRKQTLDALVAEKLLEKEAKTRGIAVEQMLKDEIDRQIPAPDPAQVTQIYLANRGRFGDKPRAEVEAEIVQALAERARAALREGFTARLKEKAQVAVMLDPPRTAVINPVSAPTLGPEEAPVKIVGFADFQCPYCQRAQGVIDQVLKAYGGRVQFVHRDFPLDGHAQAFTAARAARCAGEQGRYWDYYRSLMLEKGDMSGPDLRRRATDLKLDLAPFDSCLASDRHDVAIREGLEAGMKLGVSSTPTFFVNGQMLVGAQPFEQFQEVIEAELKRAS
jgi:protein-disulfide isomerase